MNLTQILRRSALCFPARTALIDENRELTWSELLDRVGRFAGVLHGLGLQPHDRVAMLAWNSHRYIEYYYGTVWAGGIAVPLNHRLALLELVALLEDSGARYILVDRNCLEMGRAIHARLPSLVILFADEGEAPEGWLGYEALLAKAVVPADAEQGGEDTASIFYTGGTTGRPKGVMQSHDNLMSSAIMYVAHYGMNEHTVLLSAAPLFHVSATAVVVPALMAGGTTVLLSRFTAESWLKAIPRYGVTMSNAVPTMLKMIVDDPTLPNCDRSSLRTMIYGAAPMHEELLYRALEVFPTTRFFHTYGQTEITTVATIGPGIGHADADKGRQRWCSVGRPTMVTELAVMDTDGAPVPHGEIGEIAARSPLVMKGYWKNPDATAAAIRNGWLYTGDLGYLDDDGFVWLVDRKKDMIISGGENVYSTEVEAALLTHPAIRECAVIGMPDPVWGEVVHAVIVLREGAQASAEEITLHCRGLIAGYKCPRIVTIRPDQLPLNGSGKVMKNVLRDEMRRAAQGVASA